MKTLLAIALGVALFAGVSVAGETQNADQAAQAAQLNYMLNNLQGMEGMHGGTSQDMSVVLGVMQSPEMLNLVSKLSAQMTAQNGQMDPNAVNDFVRQNLSLEDIQKILGPGVSQQDLDKALASEVKPEEIQEMLRLMTGGKPGAQ